MRAASALLLDACEVVTRAMVAYQADEIEPQRERLAELREEADAMIDGDPKRYALVGGIVPLVMATDMMLTARLTGSDAVGWCAATLTLMLTTKRAAVEAREKEAQC